MQEISIQQKKYMFISVLVILFLLLGIYWWFIKQEEPAVDEIKQEFTTLNVVQFYLHLPGGDIIVGRKSPKFEEVKGLIEKIIISAHEQKPSPFAGENDVEKAVTEIESNSVSLAGWLMAPQEISTNIKAESEDKADKFGNKIIKTDRILLVLGGKYRGQVLTKVPDTETEWQAWKVSNNTMLEFVDLIKAGGL